MIKYRSFSYCNIQKIVSTLTPSLFYTII